ncbi:MAG: hypothetical protein AAB686_00705, partial [Patescibacteria group bacterium]
MKRRQRNTTDQFQKNILEFNRQLSPGGLSARNLDKLRGRKPDAVIVSGMGGSGLPGRILKMAAKEIGLNIPVINWHDYGLADVRDYRLKRPLYIFVSFSGNTEETISGLRQFLNLKPKTKNQKTSAAVIATGGKLLETADSHKLARVSFTGSGLTPRQDSGKMFYALIQV